MTKEKVIEGKNLFGEKRKYTFKLLNAKDGLGIFHKTTPLLANILPFLAPHLISVATDEESLLDKGIKAVGALGQLENMMPLAKVEELAVKMLAGAKVEIDGIVHEIGEDGIGEYAQGDPLEIYTGIFHATYANWDKYIIPLAKALGEMAKAAKKAEEKGQGEDSSQQ